MPVRHLIVGARGGQGTTTVAVALAALAARQGPTTLIAHDPEAVLGVAGAASSAGGEPAKVQLAPGLVLASTDDELGGTTVVDGGCGGRVGEAVDEDEGTTWRWLVVRGPCYLSLRKAVEAPGWPHGVILVSERDRALGRTDVADVLGRPVVAEIPQDGAVARGVDAGTLLTAAGRLAALKPLEPLLDPGLHPAYRDVAP